MCRLSKIFSFLYLAFSGLIDVGVILCVATSVKLVDVSMRLTDAIITYKCGIACRYFHIALRNNIFSLYLWSDQRANIPLRLYSNLNFMFNLISITFDGWYATFWNILRSNRNFIRDKITVNYYGLHARVCTPYGNWVI